MPPTVNELRIAVQGIKASQMNIDAPPMVGTLQPLTSRIPTVLEQIGIYCPLAARQGSTPGELRGILEVLEELFLTPGILLGGLGKWSKKQEFALDWMLSGSRGNSVI